MHADLVQAAPVLEDTVNIWTKKHGVHFYAPIEIGLLSLPDTREPPLEQYGDMLSWQDERGPRQSHAFRPCRQRTRLVLKSARVRGYRRVGVR